MFTSENQLDEWVRGNAEKAQGIIVDLVCRLVCVSCPQPKERRFPRGDSIGQSGPDGVLDTEYSFEPFVSTGRSYWEIGTGIDARKKATASYRERTQAVPADERTQTAFVFLTPLSSRRGWSSDSQERWLRDRGKRKEWRDLRVIDGTKLADWLAHWPAVDSWLAGVMGIPVTQMETAEARWLTLQGIGKPPPLPAGLFLSGRERANQKLEDLIDGKINEVTLDTLYPHDVGDFVAAYLMQRDEVQRTETTGRCILISSIEGWSFACNLKERHLLVAEPALDLAGPPGTRMLEQAHRAGHAVIYGGPPGGIPNPTRVPLPSPKEFQVREVLTKAGYPDERARVLATKSAGQLAALLRCLQNVSQLPEWADTTTAGELTIAELLGSWDETVSGDAAVVEALAGKPYGEWIGAVRDVAQLPSTPLIQREGKWHFVARYEGWYALGPRLYDTHLERLKAAAMTVLQEDDPALELPPDKQYAAALLGKPRRYSPRLRNGIAETLALFGSLPRALTSCSVGQPETTAAIVIRDLLSDADSTRWASLNDVMPLLAEAAPAAFLDALERALLEEPTPFHAVFAQEGSGITGRNYLTGLLWALETLAWDEAFLIRVVSLFGQLAAHDPGGQWANRPLNSLVTIFLPWFPQTCAPLETRMAALRTLLVDQPPIGWKLLLSLLPRVQASSFGTHRPSWRSTIPEDWQPGVPGQEYVQHVTQYATLAVTAAKADTARLADLAAQLDHLPPIAFQKLIDHLNSIDVTPLSDDEKYRLWTALYDLVATHRKFRDAKWAMAPARLDILAGITTRLTPESPLLRHRRLFSEGDISLFEHVGDWDEQERKLEARREIAAGEIGSLGIEAVEAFATTVASPWRFGHAFGRVSERRADRELLPGLLRQSDKALTSFIGGFVRGRFLGRNWLWVDEMDTTTWDPHQVAEFFAYLPFVTDTWRRAATRLATQEYLYWEASGANPYELDSDLDYAVNHLIDCGRPLAAIRCLSRWKHTENVLATELAVRAFLAVPGKREIHHVPPADELGELIAALQGDPGSPRDDLRKIEWKYLELLDPVLGRSPVTLENDLARDPKFFCEVLRLIYHPKGSETTAPPDERTRLVALNGYRLLSKWRTPPGHKRDSPFDGQALIEWLRAVRQECAATGHLEVALITVGRVLAHAPSDPSGLWLHRAVAAALNAPDAADMRRGYQSELFNSRGVFGFTEGRAEQALADQYNKKALALEQEGFHRLGSTLRELASTYAREAVHNAEHSPFEEP
jgi:hypothetical protein